MRLRFIEVLIVLAIAGILMAITLPGFFKFRARARQAEARANLRAIYTAVQTHFAEKGTYACDFCGFSIVPGSRPRYTYRVGKAEIEGQDPLCRENPLRPSVQVDPTETTPGHFVVTAVANIDGDETCDLWSISEKNDLTNDQNDVER